MHPEAEQKHVYIETFGCQMNERDSEIMGQLLAGASYAPTADPARADLAVINTCSIRGKAEQKAYSLLGRLGKIKARRPGLVIAVVGCVAQQEGDRLLERMPYLDLVVGPQNIYRLPELVRDATKGDRRTATTLAAAFEIPPFLPDVGQGPDFKRFVTIMQGCNNFCTYCVVPYTRGREVSRRFDDILDEVRHLAARGIREVTLLGQNVNSYGRDGANGGQPSFAELLRAVAAIDGIERLRFTTSHPKDLSEELMRCFAEIDSLCPHFHLPVQSGSDRVLKRMNRRYTIATYLDRVEKLRSFRPDIALTTDIIVGFPGESDEDFEATMALIETVRYHSAFSFKYSDRPHAKSAAFPDKVAEGVKSARLTRLQARQQEITRERNHEYIGRIEAVTVEGPSRNDHGQWSGRTGSNHVVNFIAGRSLAAGDTVAVTITEACAHSLRGKLAEPH